MKKKYFNFNLDSSSSKKYHFFLIVVVTFLFGINSYGQSITSFTPTNACTGSSTPIIITGSSFTGATAVNFNGVPSASFIVDSDTQITAVLPVTASNGDITVIGSITATSPTAFIVNPVVTTSVSIAATATTICAGTSVTFSTSPTNGGTTPAYQWYINNVAVSGETSATFITNTLVNGNQVKVIMTSNAVCPATATVTSNSITVTVNSTVIPSISISENPISPICIGTSVAFSAAVPNNGGLNPTYQWQLSTDGGTVFNDIVGETATTYSTNTLSNGDIIRLQLTSTATCASPNPVYSNLITAIVSQIPTTSNAGSDQTVCSTAATLAGNTATVGTGIWSLISGSGTISSPNSPTSGITGLGLGANTFRWTITNAPCTAISDDVVITRSDTPTIAAAGSDQSVCSTTATLAGNAATVGTGTWSLISGSGTISSPNSPTSGISGLGIGANTFRWTITNAPCTASSDDVVITRSDIPTVANAGSDQSVCSTTASLAGNTPVIGTGTWSLISGSGTISSPNSPTSGITGLGVGANTFRWTITNTPCTASSDDVVITKSDTPTIADAGSDQSICSTTASLAGNTATVGTGTWSLISGSGTITSPNSPTSGITGLGVGANTFRWTITNAPCTASSDEIVITRSATPITSNAGGDQTVCSTTATLAGNTAVIGTGTWNLINGSGTITSPNSPTSGITGLGVGANTFRWTITNAPCTASSDDIVITRSDTPTIADAGSDQSVCLTTATLAGNTATVGTGTWSLISGSGTITSPNSPSSGITGLGVGANTFRWTITNAPCTASSDEIVITRSAPPTTSNAGSDQSVCLTTASLAGNTAVIGTGTWNLISGSGTITSPNSPTSGITGLGVGTNTFRWTITNAPCTASSDDVVITRSDIPTIANAGIDQTLCVSATATLAGNTATVGIGTWSLISGSGIITSPNSPTSGITGLGAGANTFRWTITNAPCTASLDDVVITNNQNSTIALSSAIGTNVQSKCVNTAITNITYSIGGGGSGATVSGLPSGVSGSYSGGTFTISGTPSVSGTFNYTISTTGPCINTSAAGTIKIYTAPSVPPTPTVPVGQSNSICPVATGLVYSVPMDPNVVTYNWSIPTGFTITSGAGTNSITVTATINATTGDVRVSATNPCSTTTNSGNVRLTVGNFAYVNAGNDTTLCSVTSGSIIFTLNAATAGATNPNNDIEWTASSGSFSNANKASTNYTFTSGISTSGGSVTLTVTANGEGSCPLVSDQIVLTVLPPATASIAGATTICAGTSTSITFTATPNTTVTFNTNQTIAIGATGIAIFTTPILNANTTYTLNSVSYTNLPACPRVVSGSATITVNTAVVTNANLDQAVCASSPNVALNGIITGGASTGTWSGGGGTFNPNNTTLNAVYTPSAAEITSGTVTLTLTSADPAGPCDTTSDAMVITINPSVVTNANADQTVCASSPNVTLAGTITSGTTSGTWSGGGGTFTPNATTLNAVYTPSAAEISAGTVTLTLTSVDPAGSCGATSDAMVININPSVVTSANIDQTVCASSPNVTLAGTITGGASTGTWSGGGGTFNPNNTTLNAVYTPSAAEITTGTVTLTLTSVDPTGPCVATSDAMTITINPSVVTSANIDQTVCASSPNVTLAGTITGGASTGTWSGGAGTFNPNNTTLNAIYTPSAAEITAGTVTLTLTSADPTGPCDATNDTMVITINPSVVTNANADQTVCESNPIVTLAGSVSGGVATGTWSGGAGTFNPNNTTLNAIYTPSTAEITTGTVTLTLASADPLVPCGATSDAMVININPSVVTSANIDQTVCASSPNVTLAGTITGGASTGTWSGGGGTFNPNNTTLNAVYTPSAAEITTGTVTLTLTSVDPTGPCVATSDTMTITINPSVVTSANIDQTVCASSPNITIAGTITGGASTGTWSGGGGTFNPNNTTLNAVYTPSAAEITAGTVTLTLTSADPAGPCDATNDTVVITINPLGVTSANIDQAVCASSPNVTLAGSITGGASTGTWSGGTGTFTPNTSTLNAIYTPSPAEIAAGTVTLTLTSADPTGPCSTTSDAMMITINPVATVSAGSNQTICSNTTATMGGSFGGGATSATWSTSGTGSFDNNTNTAIYTPSTADISAGSVTLTYTTNDPTGPCNSVNASLLLTIKKAVVINTQPSNVGICASSPAQFGVVASGDGLTYQWYKGTFPGTAISNNAFISGAQTNILNFNQAFLADDGIYYVVISGASPCNSVNSNEVTLNVDQSILITSQPITQSICTGANVTFTVAANANGDPLTYQWRKNGANLSGQTGTSLTISNSAAGDAANYDVVISGPSGYTCPNVTSTAATLTVNPLPTISGVLTVCSGFTTQLTGSASPATVTPWVSANTTVATVNSNGLVSGVSTGSSIITYTNSNGCITTATVLVNPTPNAIATNTSQTICSGATITTMVVTGSVVPTTFNWARDNAATVTGIAARGSGDISGSLTNTTNAPMTVTFTITPTANGCPGSAITTTVIVNPTPNASATNASQTICSGATIATMAITGSVGSTTYNWIRDNSATVTGIAANGSGDISGSLTNTTNAPITVTFTITPTANGCPGSSITTTVIVNPTPNASATNASQTICSGATITTMAVTGSVPATTFNWTRDNSATVTGIAASGSGDISGSLTNTTNVPITVTFTITPTANSCPGSSITATILVNPDATISLTSAVGTNTQIKCINNAIAPITYAIVGGTGASITTGLPAGVTGVYNTGVFTISGTPTVAGTFPYTVTATGPCLTPSLSGTITVDPISVGGSLTGYATDQSGNPYNNPIVYSKNLIACLSTDGLLVLNGYTGTIISWEYSTDAGINWNTISHTTNSYSYSNIPQTRIYRAVVQSGSCGDAYSNIVTISVVPQDIKPSPVTASKNIMCLGDTTVFNAASGFATGQTITGGDFDHGQLNTQDPDGWLVNGSPSGWTANGDNTKPSIDWSGTNGPKTFGGITYNTSDNSKFGIVYGIVTSVLETPIFNTFGLSTAKLEFYQAYFLGASSNIKVELSTNGGSTYPISLQNITGSVSSGGFIGLNKTNIDLSDYVGQNKLRIRFTFTGATSNSTWALENFKLPTPPASPGIVWTDENRNIIGTTTTHSETPVSPGLYNYAVTSYLNGCVYDITPSNTVYIPVEVNLAYAGKDVTILPVDCGNNSVTLNAYDNRETANKNIADGAFDNNYQASNHPGTGATGKWTIKSTSTCGTGTFSNDTDPNATFTGESGTYVLTWTAGGCSDDVQIIFTDCTSINFDGVNDNITFKDNYNLTNSCSIEVWVKPNSVTGTQTIFSKRDANNLATGYDLKLVGSKVSFNWNNSGSVVSNYNISTSRWYHIAVTFDTGASFDSDGVYRLYIDGIEVSNPQGVAGDKPITNTFDCILGAMDQTGNPPNKPVKHFNGWIDELRIWNVPLTPEQLHQMMNQEIINSPTVAGNVQGAIVPIDVNGITWTTNLLGYYQMSNISCGYLNPTKGTAKGKLRNITTAEEQTAPIPYTSSTNGNWNNIDTWNNKPLWITKYVWDYPNSTGYNGTPIDWNIVRTNHNIISATQDVSLLGLLVDANKLTITGSGTQDENNSGTGLFISHYLKLNGNIDLVGESQLVEKRYTPTQFSESILDATSLGFIKRDQQGKKNSYNYNYWSSPVSFIQGSANNVPYTIKNILMDGTTSAEPKLIDFGADAYFADGPISNPIKITNRWIWSYNAPITLGDHWGNYYKWYNITSNGALKVGEGFTMKGTGGAASILSTQNYSFVGKPNSGTITLSMSKGNSYLVGNPYPSALDANEFILDNLAGRNAEGKNVFNGALYYWDHFGTSNNHFLAEYQGGYATYNLLGSVKALEAVNNSPLTLNNGVKGSNLPKQFIPVGQGFFVDGFLDPSLGVTSTVDGGTIQFKNSQRVFQRESSTNSSFMKTSATKKTKTTDAVLDTRPKIRLGFDSSIGEHRQLLVGADLNTTNLFDIGYDAPLFGTNANDMYWEISNSKFVIQGVPDFGTNQTIPLGVVVAGSGEVKIKIDELENINLNTKIYLFDLTTGIYHDLRKGDFTIALTKGEYNKRFSLKFENQTLDVLENDPNDGILVFYSRNFKTLIIKNNDSDSTVNTVSLFNMAGKAITKWNVANKEQTNIQIPIKNMPSEIYIVKVSTSKGVSSKKIIIN